MDCVLTGMFSSLVSYCQLAVQFLICHPCKFCPEWHQNRGLHNVCERGARGFQCSILPTNDNTPPSTQLWHIWFVLICSNLKVVSTVCTLIIRPYWWNNVKWRFCLIFWTDIIVFNLPQNARNFATRQTRWYDLSPMPLLRWDLCNLRKVTAPEINALKTKRICFI
jgi:hypothetical protein